MAMASEALPLACVVVMGCASLFSWNAVITISSYWSGRLCGSAFERNFESVFAVTYQITSLFANLYALKSSQEASVRARVVPTQKALIVVFVVFAVLAVAPKAPRDAVFVPVTLFGVGCCGMFSQFLSAAVYGMAASLQGGFNAANMAGQAVGGVIPALIVVVTVLSDGAAKPAASNDDAAAPAGDDGAGGCGPVKADGGAVGYFVAAAALYVASIAAFNVLERTAVFAASGLARGSKAPPTSEVESEDGLQASLLAGDPTLQGGGGGADDDDDDDDDGAKPPPKVAVDARGMVALAAEIRVPAAAVFLVFACTLAPFPALTALARPWHHQDDDGGDGDLFRALFVPLLFLEFNVFDFVGRSMGGFVDSPGAKALLVASLARFLFIPLIALGTLSGGGRGVDGLAFLRASPTPFVVMAPFALSNGLVATLAMGEAANALPPHKRELGGNTMSLFLMLGLAAGSALSFALLALV